MIPSIRSATSPPSFVATAAAASPAQGTPVDSVTLGSPTSAPAPTPAPASSPVLAPDELVRMALGQGPPNALGVFFGPEADKAVHVKHTPEGLEFKFDYVPTFSRSGQTRTLPKDAAVGWSSAWGQMYRPPFGCWTRRDGCWESATMHRADDRSLRDESLLVIRFPDDGPPKMALWETLKAGGGVVYELDAEGWLRQPGQVPPILDMQPYSPGEAPKSGLLTQVPDNSRPPGWTQLFGPAAPAVKMIKRDKNEGCGLQLKFEWGGTREVYLPLLKECKPGFVHESFRMQDQIWQRWERTPEGWVGETTTRPEAPTFGTVRSVKLRTEVDEDGGFRAMTMRVEGRAGDVSEYTLDGDAFLRGEVREPAVTGVSRTAAPPPPPPTQVKPPEAAGIKDGGEWIIIDGIKIQKHRR